MARLTNRHKVGDDLTSIIETLDDLEDRLGVRFEAVSALVTYVFDDHFAIYVRGELRPSQGTALDHDMTLIAAAYDSQGRIVHRAWDPVSSEAFFGFKIFQLEISLPNGMELAKIRLFPEPA